MLITQRVVGIEVGPALVLAGGHHLLHALQVKHVRHLIKHLRLALHDFRVDEPCPVILDVVRRELQVQLGETWADLLVLCT